MPKYDVTFTRTIIVTGRLLEPLTAKDEDTATEKAARLIDAICQQTTCDMPSHPKVEWELDADDYEDIEVSDI